ncbi:MAG: tRNA dihydrouridine synthase DusB [Neisseriaceae bacterium]
MMAFYIGKFQLRSGLALSPMAGITDRPFRDICRKMGADWVVGEMISGNPTVRHNHKTLHRIPQAGEQSPIVVQLVGNSPQQLAQAAQHYEESGADVIDLNFGCPAKKVCQSEAGSALLKDPILVEKILEAVVCSITIPVTIKTRLGWDDDNLNILDIAQRAQGAGVQAIAIHGRSRTQKFQGVASYELIKQVKERLKIPVWANGDITSPDKALRVLEETGVDGLMLGRAAQGAPWIFQEIKFFLERGRKVILPFDLISRTIREHLEDTYQFYCQGYAYRIARKHIGWYLKNLTNDPTVRAQLLSLEGEAPQFEAMSRFLEKAEVEDHYYSLYSTTDQIQVN